MKRLSGSNNEIGLFTPVQRSRYGRIEIDSELLFTEQCRDALYEIGFIPVRVAHNPETNLFELDGCSRRFRETADAEAVPRYEMRIRKWESTGSVTAVEVVEV